MNLADCFQKHHVSTDQQHSVLTRVAQLMQQGVERKDAERQAVTNLAAQVKDSIESIREQLAAQGHDVAQREIKMEEQASGVEVPEGFLRQAPLNSNVDLDRSVSVVDAGAPAANGGHLRNMRKAALANAKAHVGEHINADTGWAVTISARGARHVAQDHPDERHYPAMVQAIAKLDEIVKSAVLVESHADTKNQAGVDKVHRLYAPVKVGDDVYVVKMTVKEAGEGYKELDDFRLYDLKSEKKMLTGTSTPSSDRSQNPTWPAVSISKVTLREMLDGVNDNEGAAFFQGEQRDRGFIAFGPQYVIGMFKGKADLSTLLHESGHLFVKSLEEIVATGKADSQLVADLKTLKEFAGDFDSVAGQERIARGFEAYLMEGRAPTQDLVIPFRRFRSWLLAIYKDVRNLDVELNDEVRGVFDRMLGAEAQANDAQEFYSSSQIEGEIGKHLSDGERAKLMAARGKSREATMEKQASRLLGAWRRAMGGKAALESQARETVKRAPVYQAMDRAATEGGMNKQALVDLIGEEQVAALRKKRVGIVVNEGGVDINVLAMANHYLSAEEMLADMVLAPTQTESVERIVQEQLAQKEAEIRAELNDEQVMPADSGYHNDETLSAIMLEYRAMQRVANEKRNAQKANPEADKARERAAAAQGKLDEMQRQAEEQRKDAQAAREEKWAAFRDQMGIKEALDMARGILSGQSVRDALSYRVYAAAERKFAKEAIQHAKAGRWAEAAESKRREMLNHALVLQAIEIQKEVTKGLKDARKFVDAKKMQLEHREQILALVERFSLGTPSVAPVNREQLAPLSEFLKHAFGEEDSLFNPKDFYSEEMLGLPATRYKDLQVEQFREIMLLLRDIAEHGAPEQFARLLTEEGRPPLQHELEKLTTTLVLSGNETKLYDEGTLKDNLSAKQREFFAGLNMRMDMLRRADGYLDSGPKNSHKVGPFMRWGQKVMDGLSRLKRMQREAFEVKKETDAVRVRYEQRFKKLYGERAPILNGVEVPTFMRAVGRYTWTAEHIWSLARNMGNEGNVRYITEGLGLTYDQVVRLTSILTESEWRAIEKEMHLVGRNYEESAAIFRLVYNRQMPERVVPQPFKAMTAEGKILDMPGWYYPFDADSKLNRDIAAKKEGDALTQDPNVSSFRPSIQKSFTKARKGSARATSLRYDVFEKSLHDQMQFISLAPVIKDMDTILRTQAMRESWEKAFGAHDYKETIIWLKNIYNPVFDRSNSFDGVLDEARRMGVVFALAMNLKSALRQYNGFFPAAKEIGEVWVIKGIGAMTKGRIDAVADKRFGGNTAKEMVDRLSSFMEDRDRGGFSAEMREVNTKTKAGIKVVVGDKVYTRKDVAQFAMGLSHMADAHVTYAVWMGAYMKGKEALNMTDVDAVKYADRMVEKTQVASTAANLNQWQRDPSGMQKIFASFMSEAFRKGSRMRTDFNAWRTGKKTMAEYGRDVFYDVGMQVVYNTAIISLMGSVAPDDWKDWFWSLWGEVFGVYPMGNVPASYFQYGSKPGQIPAMNSLEKPLDLIKDTAHLTQSGGSTAKKKEATYKALIDFVALGLGVGNVRKLYEDAARGWKDIERGKTSNPLRLLIAEPKDKRK